MIVADAFDAMTTSRIYKGRKNVDEALSGDRIAQRALSLIRRSSPTRAKHWNI
jgi:hypothetical protein